MSVDCELSVWHPEHAERMMGIKKAEFRRGKAILGSISSRWCISTIRTIYTRLPSTFRLTPRQLDVGHEYFLLLCQYEEFLLPVYWSPYIFEYMTTTNHTLFEKDGVFGFHINTCHLEQLVAVAKDMFTLYSTDRSITVHVHIAYVPHAMHVGHGFIIASLFGTYQVHVCLPLMLISAYAY